ncbi:peptide deformylase [Pseudoruegeria sp. SHC-113]|uniref:peptide deformylase n=1 Tax=Pseudoruegeria sp. SHC-113 TaxID=2855439 RepID=UPI0021BB355E|nr:peptide deformylase [Pseudoruegeria sp. SHC-113]MCT8159216.1 peptide deformylase [Pseudoruegeria sp. SHC-113]
MSRLAILRWPDPRLAAVCEAVTDIPAAAALAQNMLETMYAAPGRGLAAPQVGVLKRLFVMDVTWKEGAPAPLICINPEVVSSSEERGEGEEGCLSIPGVTALVRRPLAITLRYLDETGGQQEAALTGFAARCAQHELDHLDGLVTFDRLPPEARAPLEAQYEAQP